MYLALFEWFLDKRKITKKTIENEMPTISNVTTMSNVLFFYEISDNKITIYNVLHNKLLMWKTNKTFLKQVRMRRYCY
jgi:hypothetical protein